MTGSAGAGHDEVVLQRRAEAAFLGAAIGDALGWPHELRARRAGKPKVTGGLRYEDWIKRGGGRFQAFEEHIPAGSYSDDTQLILAVARALRRSRRAWWEILAYEELPFWTAYERGGGGATKRAASCWAHGSPPWLGKPVDVRRYFEAGGNGVAMRILPHAVRRARDEDFRQLARDVLADGVCTHGHPRALIGAMVYAFATWTAIRHRGTLGFGQLVDETMVGAGVWGRMPRLAGRWPDWANVARGLVDLDALWKETVQEQVDLLARAAGAIAAGAASFDEETLAELGCFDPRVNGAGTVTAAGAIYLASRHAADPHEALRVSALAQGADTDTLASMTCGLLGAAVGGEWLERYVGQLQDAPAIAKAPLALLRGDDEGAEPHPAGSRAISAFAHSLAEVRDRRVRLPVGTDASVEPWDGITSKSPGSRATGWLLRSDDGQTFFLRKMSRAASESPAAQDKIERDLFAGAETSSDFSIGVRISVLDLEQSRRFYGVLIGIAESREGRGSVSFGRLALRAGRPSPADLDSLRLYIERSDVAMCYDRMRTAAVQIVSPIITRGDRRHFRCKDPDGYEVEIYEVDPPAQPA